MTSLYFKPFKTFVNCLFFLLTILSTSVAQSTEICEDGDCPSEVMNIPLDASPNKNATVDPARTQQYKTAYLDFRPIRQKSIQNQTWNQKYRAWELGGERCLRFYQLESAFVYEYEHNTDFKAFIDQIETDIPAFKKTGFTSSRRAINLQKRMDSKCPRQAKKAEEKNPALKDLPDTYQELGVRLGYFDEKGNVLKPMEMPEPQKTESAPAKQPKLSKKQQVAQLKEQVAQLPVGPKMQEKINNVSEGLKKAKPKLGLFKKLMGAVAPRLAALLPPPVNLLAAANKLKDKLGFLKNFKPKLPKLGLMDKIKGLFNRGKKLADKVKDTADTANNLRDKFDKLTEKGKDLEKELDKRTDAINKLQDKLTELAKKKEELTAKLEDKPKKILDQLKQEVGDIQDKAKDLSQKVDQEDKAKDKLLAELDQLNKQKDAIEEELGSLEKVAEQLKAEEQELAKATAEVEAEVEQVKKEEAEQAAKEKAVKELKENLAALPTEEKLEEEIKVCEEDLKALLVKIAPVEKVQSKFKEKMKGILGLPGKLLNKISNLKLFQNKLKLGKKGIPVADKALAKIDNLMNQATVLSGTVEILTGKKTKLQEKIEGIDEKFDNIKTTYESKVANLEQTKAELMDLIAEKSGLKNKLNQPIDKIETVDGLVKDFIKRYNLFDEKEKCISKEDLEKKIAEVEAAQAETAPEIETLEKELTEAAQEEADLETESKEVETEIEEAAEQAEALKEEEKAIKETFGKDMKLDPVEKKEWAESFEIERPYWDAVFHPDNEVVEGYVGKYFQIRLKDAEKNVKLLFGPGEYFMEKTDFRDNYGSTIGAFVVEALHSMKKTDAGAVKLFVQGSADISGHNTFRGKMDSRYMYEGVTVLPQKDNSDSFSGAAMNKSIPSNNFNNTHLPDLRGNYLKEMISVYSKKLDPILLEGAVKKVKGEGERNAVIYLFIPEALLIENE